MMSEPWAPLGARPDLAFFIPSFRGGGAETAVIRLANWFSQHSVVVDLLVLEDSGPLKGDVNTAVHVVNLGTGRASRSIGPLRRYLGRSSPRLLVSNMSHLNLASLAARRLARTDSRLMLIEHRDVSARAALESGLKEALMRMVMRRVYPQADLLSAVSAGAAASLAADLGLPQGQVEVLPNSIDLSEIQAMRSQDADHRWLGADQQTPVFVSVGRLEPVKGYSNLLQAVALYKEQHPVKLILVGEGSQRNALETQRRSLGLEDSVDLPGFVKNPIPLVAAADAFVLSSRSEGQGMVLLEAMAVGTPIVATDCPSGPRELLDGGKAGLLVPVDDPAAMAEAMHIILHDAALRDGLREAGLRQVQRYDIEQVAVRFMDLSRRAGFTIKVDDND